MENQKNEYKKIKTFDEMGLDTAVLRGIYSYGFEKPSEIQKLAILPFISGRDIIAQAQSGTGKTGTFSIGILQLIDKKNEKTQAIILSPTRELAKQTYNVIRGLGSATKITIKELIGGIRSTSRNTSEEHNEQIIVGTPGKILDELIRGKIKKEELKLLVLDEADEMLSKGFREQIQGIFKFLSKDVQIGLFSATISNEILDIADEFMNNPHKILIKNEGLTLEGIKQFYVYIELEKDKYNTLIDLFSSFSVTQSIIYCNTRKKVYNLTSRMRDNNFTVSCIYGDMPQIERNKVMESFRSGETRVLITTDILARGIDVQQVSLVINYDLPQEVETYIHRTGRTGRYGRIGVAISFVTKYDYGQLKYIEKYYSTIIEELPANITELIQ